MGCLWACFSREDAPIKYETIPFSLTHWETVGYTILVRPVRLMTRDEFLEFDETSNQEDDPTETPITFKANVRFPGTGAEVECLFQLRACKYHAADRNNKSQAKANVKIQASMCGEDGWIARIDDMRVTSRSKTLLLSGDLSAISNNRSLAASLIASDFVDVVIYDTETSETKLRSPCIDVAPIAEEEEGGDTPPVEPEIVSEEIRENHFLPSELPHDRVSNTETADTVVIDVKQDSDNGDEFTEFDTAMMQSEK